MKELLHKLTLWLTVVGLSLCSSLQVLPLQISMDMRLMQPRDLNGNTRHLTPQRKLQRSRRKADVGRLAFSKLSSHPKSCSLVLFSSNAVDQYNEQRKSIIEQSEKESNVNSKRVSSTLPLELSSEDNEMPWSQLQDWILRDHLPKYTVLIPIETENGKTEHKSYTLWRTMLRDVIELAGYPIEFLQKMHLNQIQRNDTAVKLYSDTQLPFLDQFEFTNSGGLSGAVYGIRGISDGTRIETAPVENVQLTIPIGYALTTDGSTAYELGSPSNENDSNSFDGSTSKVIKETAERFGSISSSIPTMDESQNAMFLRLGGMSTILLGGAIAMNMLSHHLTVNIFWV